MNDNTSTVTGRRIIADVGRMMKLINPTGRDVFNIHEIDYVKIPVDKKYLFRLNVIVHRDQTKKESRHTWWWWRLLYNYFNWRWLYTYRKIESIVQPGTVIVTRSDYLTTLGGGVDLTKWSV